MCPKIASDSTFINVSTIYSAVDDVVLDYVVEVLSNLGDCDENSFDVDQLCEMIAAYVPEFAQVDRCETH